MPKDSVLLQIPAQNWDLKSLAQIFPYTYDGNERYKVTIERNKNINNDNNKDSSDSMYLPTRKVEQPIQNFSIQNFISEPRIV